MKNVNETRGRTLKKLLKQIKDIWPVSKEEIVVFFKQLSAMYQAGIPLVSSIGGIAKSQEEGKFKEALKMVFRDLLMGELFSKALTKHKAIFSGIELGMIKVGEETGKLDKIIERIVAHKEKDLILINKVKAALIYPLVVFIGSVILVFVLMNFLFVNLLETISQFGLPIPFSTLLLLNFARLLKNPILFVLLLVIVFLVGNIIKKYIDTPQGKENRDALFLKLPLVGKIVQKIVSARFCRALGALYDSGISIILALPAAAEVTGNYALVKEIRERLDVVKGGTIIALGIFSSPIFPPLVGRMVRTGEHSGKLGYLLIKVAEFYENEVSYALETFMTTIEPFMIGVIGVIVGFIMYATLSPLYNMIATFSG